MEADFAKTGAADPEALNAYGTLCNTLRRLLADGGLERKEKPPMTFDEYVAKEVPETASNCCASGRAAPATRSMQSVPPPCAGLG